MSGRKEANASGTLDVNNEGMKAVAQFEVCNGTNNNLRPRSWGRMVAQTFQNLERRHGRPPDPPSPPWPSCTSSRSLRKSSDKHLQARDREPGRRSLIAASARIERMDRSLYLERRNSNRCRYQQFTEQAHAVAILLAALRADWHPFFALFWIRGTAGIGV